MQLDSNFKPIFARKKGQVRFITEEEKNSFIHFGTIEEKIGSEKKLFHTPWGDTLEYSDETHYIICNVMDAQDAYPIEKGVFHSVYHKVHDSNQYEKKEVTQCYIYEGVVMEIHTKEGVEVIHHGDIIGIDTDGDIYPIRNFDKTYEIC